MRAQKLTHTNGSYQLQFKKIVSVQRQGVKLDEFDEDRNAIVVSNLMACSVFAAVRA